MFEEKITDLLHYMRFEKRYATHTIAAYTRDLTQFRHHLATVYNIDDPKVVTHFHVRSWLAAQKNEQKDTARTLNRKLSSVSVLYKYLRKTGHITHDPVRKLHAQRLPERLPTYIKEHEAEHMLEELRFAEGYAGLTERLICELLYATGMRRAELMQLKEKDIEWGLKQVRILGKGNKERLMPVSEALLDTVRYYIQAKRELPEYDTTVLLTLESGKPLYANYVYRVVKKYLAASTTLAKKSPHVLRHSFATHLLNNGANIQAIKDLLGHSSLAATQIYTHNNIDKLKDIHRQNHPRG
ncbi:tyrosine recombinase XerC [Nemorincola caseinilytica]|uniref:Tyrosine recombinase XerC n=1 Tax=Nemorincola caseinilytica TaxID=2054315 RepID=A0ABP8NL46_9BACT